MAVERDRSEAPIATTERYRLPPASFSVVMGTTVVAVDLDVFGYEVLAAVLLGLAALAYLIVGSALLWRLWRDRSALDEELRSPAAGPGHLTAVAATAVLGTGLVRIRESMTVPVVLLVVAVAVLATILTLLLRSVSAPRRTAPTWLLISVALLSTSILVSGLAEEFPQPVGWFVALALSAAGAVAYLVMIGPVLRRLGDDLATPAAVSPAHWIDAGLPGLWAISMIRLADTATAGELPLALDDTTGAMRTVAVAAWGLSMALSPPVLALGVWRHGRARVPFRYDTGYWALVFPTGIITLATAEVGRVTTTPWIRDVAHVWTFLVFALWFVIGAAMIRRWAPRLWPLRRATWISGP